MKKCLVLSLIVCLGAVIIGTVMADSSNGRAGTTPAYYDAKLFTVNLKHMPENAAGSLLEHNKSINIIYRSEGTTIPGNGPWVDVLNAIQGDGFNPLWQEVTVQFNVPPFQLVPPNPETPALTSDNAILAAAAITPDPPITLVPTTEVYRCAVIGPDKPKK